MNFFKRAIKLSFILLPVFVFANSNFVSFIEKNNKNSYKHGGFNDITEISNWVSINNIECEYDKLEEDVYYNLSFDQNVVCTDTEERTITTTRNYNDGNSIILSSTNERRKVDFSNDTYQKTGTHLESSCNDIIVNGYANNDGVYTIGTHNDNFNVYCDMRNTEGWTLVAKSPSGDGSAPFTTPSWFINGIDSANILNTSFPYNGTKSAIGIDKIKKMSHTSIAEIQFISEDQTQNIPFYKSFIESNLDYWFVNTEPTETRVCTDSSMTTNCSNSSFLLNTNRYWLIGVDVRKYGFYVAHESTPDVHYSYNSYGNLSPTICSVTTNLNNNAWHDSAIDGHWGNGIMIFIK